MRQYRLIESEPYCCVTSSLESILLKHGYNFDQIAIADFFGVTVPTEEYAEMCKKFQNVKASNEVHDIGIHLDQKGLNSFFEANNIKLKETFIKASELSELNFESILDAVSQDSDIMFFFDYGVLYDENRNIGVGHDGIYICKKNDKLIYLDSGPRRLGTNEVNILSMLNAMKRAYAGGGLSVITTIR